MELKRHNNSKFAFVGLYFVALAIYIAIGLQPAEAVNYIVDTQISVPSIGLVSDVTKLEPVKGDLPTPDTIVGSYSDSRNKTLLIGHSSTVFKDLDEINLEDAIYYNNKQYEVVSVKKLAKAEIDMNEILSATDEDTVIVMTCAGQMLPNSDATHRLIVTAVAGK